MAIALIASLLGEGDGGSPPLGGKGKTRFLYLDEAGPVVTQGRKAAGLTEIAGLPKE